MNLLTMSRVAWAWAQGPNAPFVAEALSPTFSYHDRHVSSNQRVHLYEPGGVPGARVRMKFRSAGWNVGANGRVQINGATVGEFEVGEGNAGRNWHEHTYECDKLPGCLASALRNASIESIKIDSRHTGTGVDESEVWIYPFANPTLPTCGGAGAGCSGTGQGSCCSGLACLGGVCLQNYTQPPPADPPGGGPDPEEPSERSNVLPIVLLGVAGVGAAVLLLSKRKR